MGSHEAHTILVRFYASMCVVGTVLPYAALGAWVVENGVFDIGAMVVEIAASRMSMFAWLDVLVSAVVLVAFICSEGRRASTSLLWAPIVATCVVGVSLGLPLFLLLRERALRRHRRVNESGSSDRDVNQGPTGQAVLRDR